MPVAAPLLITLFGRPGAGKGTVAQELAALVPTAHCSTGQAMREWSLGSRPEQRALRDGLARGEYGSDELAAQIIAEFLSHVSPATRLVVLDGFPRNPAQLDAWESLLPQGLALVIESSEAQCRERLSRRVICPSDGWTGREQATCPRCGRGTERRDDDTDAVSLRRRFDAYERLVVPTIAAWEKRGWPLRRLPSAATLAALSRATRLLAMELDLTP